MNYLFEKVRRSLGGPFFLRPISVLQLPFFVLRTPCFVALLRETCPATDARGRVVFAGPSCPRWDSCEFLGFCPAAVARTLRFRRVCPVNLAGSCGFAFLLFLGGDALCPCWGISRVFRLVSFLSWRSVRCENKNLALFATFLRLGALFSISQSENGR